jgi:hypothetical protein
MSKLNGSWSMVKSENFEDYLKAVGVGYVIRKLAAQSKPTLQIINCNKAWSIKMFSSFKSMESTFTEGKPFEEVMPDGQKSQSIAHTQGNSKLVQTQKFKNFESQIVREVNEEGLLVQVG